MVSTMNKFLDLLFTMIRYVGVFLAVFGGYQLVTSFTDDRPEDKKKAIALIVGGIALFSLKTLMASTGILDFSEVTSESSIEAVKTIINSMMI